MAIGFWPLILMNVREIQMDRKFAEKDINLTLYGRTVYIVTQVIIPLLVLMQRIFDNLTIFIAVHFKLCTQFVHLAGLFIACS